MENQTKAQKEGNKGIFIIVGVIILIFAGLYLFTSSKSQGNNSKMAPEPTVATAPEGSAEELIAQKWNWVNTKMSDGAVINPSAPGKFGLTFGADLSLLATTDCNSGRGSYVVGTDNSMAISQLATTMMFCESSNETDFYRDLGNVGSYKISDGQLWLMLKYDSGTMIFKK